MEGVIVKIGDDVFDCKFKFPVIFLEVKSNRGASKPLLSTMPLSAALFQRYPIIILIKQEKRYEKEEENKKEKKRKRKKKRKEEEKKFN